MRVLGVDLGRKRIGLAISDASATLARPWQSIAAGATPRASATLVAAIIRDAAAEDPVDAVVVGLPRRLNGEDTDQTTPTREFATALADLAGVRVHLQDERLTSVEAESRLAVRERDWRKRKAKIDAAAAAIILQDYLDSPRVDAC
ncbi:MAG TPA: Holliday junction resolvase RuvX [Vicinamibacterales bacterium]|nr:Holliday junction resolvase RuvX [Vicinamibacterales bacterium]